MDTFFEKYGGTYRMVDGYRIPNLTLPDESEYEIGIWGQRRLDYLKKHRKGFYAVLCASDKLSEHLHEIDVAAFDRWELIIRQMMQTQGVTEQLKAQDAMLWVGKVNNIRACADEVVRNELIYD